jgi:hypothetical protein
MMIIGGASPGTKDESIGHGFGHPLSRETEPLFLFQRL